MKTTLTRERQVTIPKHIRKPLNLEPGCKLVFDVNPAG
jgi:AbrB family looped-hinge helix DNA binding protein